VSPTTCAAPTTAERIRSVCASATGALLAVDGDRPLEAPVQHLLDDGSFAVALPVDRAGGHPATGPHALLELTDYAPLALREPIRAVVWARGRLTRVAPEAVIPILDRIAIERPDPALLQVETPLLRGGAPRYELRRLDVVSVVAADAAGAESVGPVELLAARPDPFCRIESSLVRHLATAHPEVVARLVSRLQTPLRRGRVRPLGLDRYGLSFRVERTDGDYDVRLPFPAPVSDMAGLSRAVRVLMGCPFLNGLRARAAPTP